MKLTLTEGLSTTFRNVERFPTSLDCFPLIRKRGRLFFTSRMALFKPTILSVIPPPLNVESIETVKWAKAVQKPRIVKELGAITGLDIHPLTRDVLVTASRIHMYDELFQDKKSFYSNSHFTLFSASFRRNDGRLIVTGNQVGSVLVYDATSSKPLRDFNNPKTRHSAAVRKSLFYGRNQVLTFSDDKSVRLWDLADGHLLTQFGKQLDAELSDDSTISTAHSGYVRAGCIVDFNNSIASGSYDSTVKMWDPRENHHQPIKTFSVKNPVESMFAKKSLIMVSAGKSIYAYDIVAGKILQEIRNTHTKTITCLSSYNDEYFMSGSLDGVLKIFNLTFKEVAQFKHPSTQILNMATHEKHVVVGSSEGTVFAHLVKKSVLEGQDEDVKRKIKSELNIPVLESNVVVVDANKTAHHREKLRECDKFMKTYQFTNALDSVLKKYYFKGRNKDHMNPEVVVSVMQEMIRRSVLKRAMSGLKGKQLKRLAKFLTTHLENPHFHRTMLDVTHAFVETFGSQVASDEEILGHYFPQIHEIINNEFETLSLMTSLGGQIKLILDNS